jgi:hypothetical protein
MFMNSTCLPRTIGAFLLSTLALLGTAKAQIVSHSKDVVIEQPTWFPCRDADATENLRGNPPGCCCKNRA